MAYFLLAPMGSHGDVHPFVAIGKALLARGHRVAMITSPHFETLARNAGFEFDAVGTEADFQAMMDNPNLWHRTKSLEVLFNDAFGRLIRENYQRLAARYTPGETVCVGGTLSFAARILHDAKGAPLATVHLQPSAYLSVSDPPVFPTLRPRAWWPRWIIKLGYWYGERIALDRLLGPAVNGLRRELNLPLIRRIFGAWRHSPQLILGLFPEWFGRARDWPPHLHCTGFVRYDQSDSVKLSPEVEAFLSAGEPPIVISIGSAMRTGRQYFEAAVEACRRLGRRGLLLARGGDQIPSPLPPNVLHADYAPFSLVLHRAAAVIHHGGIGTSAQALAAGVPQLVMPLAFDQFDNADRLLKLGVARSLPARKFTAARAEAELRSLFADSALPARCMQKQSRLGEDPMPRIVPLLEGLHGKTK